MVPPHVAMCASMLLPRVRYIWQDRTATDFSLPDQHGKKLPYFFDRLQWTDRFPVISPRGTSVMAKKAARQAEEVPEETVPAQPTSGNVESVAGYFRRLFDENPQLLKERSNEALLQRW